MMEGTNETQGCCGGCVFSSGDLFPVAHMQISGLLYSGPMAVGDFIKHAVEVIANAALSLYNTAVSTVKSAVAVVKKF